MRHVTRAELDQIYDSILGQRLGAASQHPYTESAAQLYRRGSRLRTPDGLTWHYCQCDALGGVAGFRDTGMASNVVPQNWTTVGAQVAGSRTLVINDTGVAAARPAGYYANGKIEIWNAIVAEHMHRIIMDSSVGNGVSITLTFYFPLTYAVPAGTGMEIIQSVYADVGQTSLVANPTFKSIVGIPNMGPITANFYLWVQTWGMATIRAGLGANMGLVANDRDVYVHHLEGSGLTTLNMAGLAAGTASPQRIGYLVPDSNGGSQTIIMLQLDP